LQVGQQPDRVVKPGEGFHINATEVRRVVGEAGGVKI
jgi:hypothetical protein